MGKPSALEPTGTSLPVGQSQWWQHLEGPELWLCALEQSDWALDQQIRPSDEESAQEEDSNHREAEAWALAYTWASGWDLRLGRVEGQSQVAAWLHKVEVRIREAEGVLEEVQSLLEQWLQNAEVVHSSPRGAEHWGPRGMEEEGHWT